MKSTIKEKKISEQLFVVGIGASAGGLDAIQQLFDNIPANTGMSFVIIQHLSPDYKSLMPELLAKHTKMKIYTATNNQLIKPNCIYLNQRNKNLAIKDNKLVLSEKAARHSLNLPIDLFFHSLGLETREKSIGIILSGTGSDGSRGIKTIKEEGGLVIVQTPSSAQFDGMPNSAIATNLVDYLLDPIYIGKELVKLLDNNFVLTGKKDVIETNNIIFNKILHELNAVFGIDFKYYKKNTLIRRLEKRMNINTIDKLNVYYNLIKDNRKELELLKNDFLIGVTSFFRDTDSFKSLKNQIIPLIFKSKAGGESIRVWTAGCSTGEEVYSIAIYLDEYIKNNNLKNDFRIFATDVDDIALNKASEGIYPTNVVNDIDRKYIESYFIKNGHNVQIVKRLRDKIVFSRHNLLKDPPFIRTDLITCRNLLIYFENINQRKAFVNFQFALNLHGYLFLGNSESLGDMSKYFMPVDSKSKIFQCVKKEGRTLPLLNENFNVPSHSHSESLSEQLKTGFRKKPNNEIIYNNLIAKTFGPSGIFFDSDLNVHFICGTAGKLLTPTQGSFQSSLTNFVSRDSLAIIKQGIKRKSDHKDVIIKNISFQDGSLIKYDVKLFSFDEEGTKIYFLQVLDEKQSSPDEDIILSQSFDGDLKQQIEDLEDELKHYKLNLQSAIEELETSNEELQSSNEELMSSNEELQSTNEELQSVNEELYTVNSEMQVTNTELNDLYSDMDNLLNSTDIGTLFLDKDLRIRKFTKPLIKHFNLKDDDIGRSIVIFTSNFTNLDGKNMIEIAKNAFKNIKIYENEVLDYEGRAFLQRIGPYLNSDNAVEGVVVTYVDISKIKETELLLRQKTLELQESINRLQRFNEAAIGREERIIELKKEINDLAVKYEKKTKYNLDFLKVE